MAFDRSTYHKKYYKKNKFRKKSKIILGYTEPVRNEKTQEEIIMEERIRAERKMKMIQKFITHELV